MTPPFALVFATVPSHPTTTKLPSSMLFDSKWNGKWTALEKLDGIANFPSTKVDIPSVHKHDLSTDQKYLIDIHQAVSRGECETLIKMTHSRWLTANRILGLYVSTEWSSERLEGIVSYVMNGYATVWFAIKRSRSIVDGAHNLFKMIRVLPVFEWLRQKNFVLSGIQRNSFFAHPENILFDHDSRWPQPYKRTGLENNKKKQYHKIEEKQLETSKYLLWTSNQQTTKFNQLAGYKDNRASSNKKICFWRWNGWLYC